MAKKKMATRTRRYRPKRTYRRKFRRYNRSVGEGYPVASKSECAPSKISQTFVIEDANGDDVIWNQDGDIIAPGAQPDLQFTQLSINPDDCIGLTWRKKISKLWKITGVKYRFYTDGLSPNNGSIAAANLDGSWDPRHCKVIYNSISQTIPVIFSYSSDADLWITQQKGQIIPALYGRNKNVWVPAMTNKQIQLQLGGSSYTDVDNLIRFPWLSSSVNNQNMSTGKCIVSMPQIRIKPLLGSTYDTTTVSGRLQLSQKFQYYYRPVIYWKVKGKYYDAALADPFKKEVEDLDMEEIMREAFNETHLGEDVCGNM